MAGVLEPEIEIVLAEPGDVDAEFIERLDKGFAAVDRAE